MQSNVAQLPLHDRLWAWFETNKKQAGLAVGAAAVIILVVLFIGWQRDEKQTAAGEALSSVATGLAEGAKPSSDAAQAYLKVATQYPGSSAGARALLQAASSYFMEGKYGDAQAQFERFLREYAGSPLRGQALFGVAACLDAQGKVDQAISAYKDVILRHPNENFVPQAKFALGRLYESQGKLEQARDQYLEVEQTARYSTFGNEAGMRVEELIAKNPKLAPAAPAALGATNALPKISPKLPRK